MSIKDNLKKGVVGNYVGLFIVVASVVSVFVPKLEIDWVNAAIGMGVGLGVMGFTNK